MKHILLSLAGMIVLVGCAVVPVGLIDSSTPLESPDGQHRQYELLGHSSGSHGYFSLFGIFPFGSHDIEAAIDNAVRKRNGDALINVRYWYRVSNYLAGTYANVEVEGDVIRFRRAASSLEGGEE